MSKPEDIPQDVIDAAADAYVAYCDERSRLTQAPTEDELLNVAARAIMAERERCAKIADVRWQEFDAKLASGQYSRAFAGADRRARVEAQYIAGTIRKGAL